MRWNAGGQRDDLGRRPGLVVLCPHGGDGVLRTPQRKGIRDAMKLNLRAMAEAGDPWAVATLARARSQALAPARPKDPRFAEAMRDALDIRQWTDGPRPAPWRVYRLAQALYEAAK